MGAYPQEEPSGAEDDDGDEHLDHSEGGDGAPGARRRELEFLARDGDELGGD